MRYTLSNERMKNIKSWEYKAQKYVFKRLFNGEFVIRDQIEPGRVAVSDGIWIFILEENQIIFNLEKCTKTDKISASLNSVEPSEVKPTNSMYGAADRTIYRRLASKIGEGNDVWIEEKFVKRFAKYRFFYGGGPTPVSVRDKSDKLIAAIMPCDIYGSIRKQA